MMGCKTNNGKNTTKVRKKDKKILTILVCELNVRCKKKPKAKEQTMGVQPPWCPCRYSIHESSCRPTSRAWMCNFTKTKCANDIFQELRRKLIYIYKLCVKPFECSIFRRKYGSDAHIHYTLFSQPEGQKNPQRNNHPPPHPPLCSALFCGVLLKTVNTRPPASFCESPPISQLSLVQMCKLYGAKAVALGKRRFWLSN